MSATPGDRFTACVAFTLGEEGGYSNDSRDPGGATNFGITLAALSHWRGTACTATDVRDMQPAEARAIYRACYWQAVCGSEMPVGVDLLVFDFGVNAGPGRSIKLLQASLGVAPDGVLGPVSMLALRGADKGKLVADLTGRQNAYYKGLATFTYFGQGWTSRLGRRAALASQAVAVA